MNLRNEDYSMLEPRLKRVCLPWGTVLHEPGVNVKTAYFPCGGSLVTFTIALPDGKDVSAALIGREGAVGGIISQGYLPAFARAAVEHAGDFLKIDISELEEAKRQLPYLRHLLVRYSDCLVAQLLQAAACNATHTIEQRTARMLLSALERTGLAKIPWTQEQLAKMLGVGRSYASRVVQKFKAIGVLEPKQRGLQVRDADQLVELCCSCHEAVRTHFETVLKGVYPSEDEVAQPQPQPIAAR